LEKLKVLITGKIEINVIGSIQICNVLDHGKVWVPSKKHTFRKQLIKIWGPPIQTLLDQYSPPSQSKSTRKKKIEQKKGENPKQVKAQKRK
jgi:hypothetical protein